MKKILVAAVALAAVASTVVPFAQANVTRYQTHSGTLTITLDNGNVHLFNIVLSPCDGSFSGAGTSDQLPTVFVTETVVGTLSGGQLSFTASYTGAAEEQFPNYQWFTVAAGPLAGPITARDNTFPGTFLVFGSLGELTASNWRNHGDYVAAQPKGSRETAAQSCIGMPIQSS